MITLKFDGKIVEVKKDDAGLYCLNDIFKASGSSMVKSPSQWNRYIKSDGGVNYAKKHNSESSINRRGYQQGTPLCVPISGG